jgi:hypothetical protein
MNGAGQKFVDRINHQTATHARHDVAGQHGADTGATSGNDEIGGLGVQPYCGKQTVHHLGELQANLVVTCVVASR